MRKISLCIAAAMIMCFSPTMAVGAQSDLIPYANELPDERLKERLVDDADLLTSEEEEELLEKLDAISEGQQCDVAVVTVNSLEDMRVQDFADDYYDYNGFGMGEDRDGIVFLVSMEEREWAFSTCGYGIDAFTDTTMSYMEDVILPYLSDGDYFDAFLTYADEADAAIRHAKNLETAEELDEGEHPYYGEDVYHKDSKSKAPVIVAMVPISILIGMIIAWFQKKRALKQYSGLINDNRRTTKLYVSNMNLTRDDVTMVGRGVNRIHSPRKKPDSGNGGSHHGKVGTSSVHRSSSGHSHGGRSGKF